MQIIKDTLSLALVISSPLILMIGVIISLWLYQNHNKPTKKHWEIRK